MAHYACDCWDAEIETCYGWLECVGIADRACFDLNAHADAAKVDLAYRERLDPPLEEEVTKVTKKACIAAMKAFEKDGKAVKEWLETLQQDELKRLVSDVQKAGKATRTVDLPTRKVGKVELPAEAKEFTFVPDMVEVEVKKEKKTVNIFMPGVVEPSFGIDRIFFAVIEHVYYARPKEEGGEDKQTRGVLAFPAAIAPYKLIILPLDQRVGRDDAYSDMMTRMRRKLGALALSYTVDDSNATIGRRYARNDELGIPFAVTVDFDSLKDGTVTLRERDSTEQIRLKAADVPQAVADMVSGRKQWAMVKGTA
jgi:glycyl-tRNA synthetase